MFEGSDLLKEYYRTIAKETVFIRISKNSVALKRLPLEQNGSTSYFHEIVIITVDIIGKQKWERLHFGRFQTT